MLPSLTKLNIGYNAGELLEPRLLFSNTEPYLQLDYHHLVCDTRKRCYDDMDTSGMDPGQLVDDAVNSIAEATSTTITELVKSVIVKTGSRFRERGKFMLTILDADEQFTIGITKFNLIDKRYQFNRWWKNQWTEENLQTSSINNSNYKFYELTSTSNVDESSVKDAIISWSVKAVASVQPQEGWSLLTEYKHHCEWLRLLYCPSTIDDDFKMKPITGSELTELQTAFDAVIKWLNISERVKLSAPVPYDLQWEQFIELLNTDFNDVSRLPLNELTHAKFARASSSTFGTESESSRLKVFRLLLSELYTTKGGVYTGNKSDSLSLEHIIPVSWTRICSMLNQFQYAGDDPLTFALSEKSVNSSRSNKPLGFTRNPKNGVWKIPSYSVFKAFLARTTVYAVMTYPLISEGGRIPNVEDPKARATGIPGYIDQRNELLRLATQKPEPWEIEFNIMTYLLFNAVNPLAMSSDVRKKFAESSDASTNPYVELFTRRLKGTDETSNALVAQIVSLVNS